MHKYSIINLYTYYYKNNKDNKDLKNKFQYCHFTLDSYTLKWLNACKIDGKPKCLKADTTWSNLNFDEYMEIQEYTINRIKNDFQDVMPIQAEFVVWKGVMLHDILKSWIKVKENYPDKDALNKVIDLISSDNNTSLKNTIDLLKSSV